MESRSPTCGIWWRWMASLSYYQFYSFPIEPWGVFITFKGCARHVFREKIMADRFYRIFDNEEDVFKETWEKYWEIQDDGTMVNIASPQKYTIEGERLTEENWLYPIFEKSGDYFNKEFFFAYMEALRRRGISQITIDVNKPMNLIKTQTVSDKGVDVKQN